MAEWQPIDTAPLDGTVIRLRRVHEGEVAFEGPGLFGRFADDAPIRQPLPDDILALGIENYKDLDAKGHWLQPNRRFRFPEPTHWQPVA